MIKEINSLNNEKIKKLNKLKQKKYRTLEQLYLIEGLHLIEEAYSKNELVTLITTDKKWIKADITNYLVTKDILKKLSTHDSVPDVMGVVKINNNLLDYDNHILVLDNIQDPGNLGNILRSACAFNLKNIIISHDSVDVFNHKVINASQGAIFKLNIKTSNLDEEIKILKEKDYLLIGSSLASSLPLSKESILTRKTALFFGNEGQGIKQNILNIMDINYQIVCSGMESLNVASAASIFFYQLLGK